jgi:Mg2+/Co2+ transporter CorB
MLALIACSAFFSSSEAALFSLRHQDRKLLQAGRPSQQLAAHLLNDPDRLLSAVLFWNLVVNMAYFAVTSIVGLQLERGFPSREIVAYSFAAGSLIMIIFFSEMLPTTVGVLPTRQLAGLFRIPLAVAVRLVEPLMPLLRLANLLSRRLLWPGFHAQPYLQ